MKTPRYVIEFVYATEVRNNFKKIVLLPDNIFKTR